MAMKIDTDFNARRSPLSSSFAPGTLPSAGPSLSSSRSLTTPFGQDLGGGYGGQQPPLSGGKGTMAPGYRRQSRFDPMDPAGEDVDDEGYGDLGSRHPLRRVQEEGKEEGVNLPSLKSLFGPQGDRASSSSHHSRDYSSPTLPPLVPPSPSSSPSATYRSSRYSSLGSSFSTISENGVGWWAPEYERDRASLPSSSALFNCTPQAPRSQSFPSAPFSADDHDAKRRRSDQPVAYGDSEEAARLRWQAQSRNASFPLAGSISGSSGSTAALRSIMAPPSAAMYRGSVSHGSAPQPTVDEDRMRPPAVPRTASLVGGQLARSFADLTAADRHSGSRSPSMGPPVLPPPPLERKPSLFPPPPSSQSSTSLPLPPEDLQARTALPSPLRESFPSPMTATATPSAIALKPDTPTRRLSVTRPPSPERPSFRRSSLTEFIMAQSGDDAPMELTGQRRPSAVNMDKPSLSEPGFGWSSSRRESAESSSSALGVNFDHPHPHPDSTPVQRGRKRIARQDEDVHDPNQTGESDLEGEDGAGSMDVLAESAHRASEVIDLKDDDRDREASPGRGMPGPKYACAYCSKTFSRPSSLRIHTYSHTGERPFVCTEPSCRRRFSVQSNLKRHAKVHQLAAAAGSSHSGHHAQTHDLFHPIPTISNNIPPHLLHPTSPLSPMSFPGEGHGYAPQHSNFGGSNGYSQGRIHPPPMSGYNTPSQPHQGQYRLYAYSSSNQHQHHLDDRYHRHHPPHHQQYQQHHPYPPRTHPHHHPPGRPDDTRRREGEDWSEEEVDEEDEQEVEEGE